MLSNLSDLLLSRVSPDPVQPVATSRTSMVGMSPASQAQVAQQQAPVQQSSVPQEAKYLQAGQPVKKFNAMTGNMSIANPTGDEDNPYRKLLKGTYGTKEVSSLTGQYETEEDTYRRMLLSHDITGENLDKKLYERERVMNYRNSLMEKGMPRKEIDKKAIQYLNQIQKEGPVAW